jgi:hypothetical protein
MFCWLRGDERRKGFGGMEGVGKSSGRLLLRLDDMDVRFGCGKDT